MISGVHAIIFSPAADEVRAFFRETLGLPFEDAGNGWLIFALPPAELAVHPAEASRHEIYRCATTSTPPLRRWRRRASGWPNRSPSSRGVA